MSDLPPPIPGRGIKKEYLLLQNLVEDERRQRAKLLRKQQVGMVPILDRLIGGLFIVYITLFRH